MTSAAPTKEDIGMKRIATALVLLITAMTLALVGPGAASAAFADNGVISSHN